MKKFIFALTIALIALMSCSDDDKSGTDTKLTFEEYGEYFASLANRTNNGAEGSWNNYLEIAAIVYEWDNWSEGDPKDSEYYGYEDDIWIQYYPNGFKLDEDVYVAMPVISISYGSGGIDIIGGLSGPLDNIQFNANGKNVYLHEGDEDQSIKGYFKNVKDFHFKRVDYEGEGEEYYNEAKPR